jgi:hypothetical protein
VLEIGSLRDVDRAKMAPCRKVLIWDCIVNIALYLTHDLLDILKRKTVKK